jgi:CDP-6-deoxy-D-xylo-4-hexulose-3-dehydrase
VDDKVRGKEFGLEELLFWRELNDRVPDSAKAARDAAATTAARELRARARQAVATYLIHTRQPSYDNRLELIRSSYGSEEFLAALDVMLDDRMTMGEVTADFERRWSRWLGAAQSFMVNSGSSANLLALTALGAPGVDRPLNAGDEVILGAVTWATSVFPIVQAGAIPVFVDVDPQTLNMDPRAVEAAVTPRTRAILAVHLLGNPCDLDSLSALAAAKRLRLVEDCCESHGARVNGRRVGVWGDLSTFSFFFSHHLTTVEGGMVSYAEDERWHDALVSLRAHGWVRGRRDRAQWQAAHPDIDDRWLFVAPGYNLRPTDIAAAFGRVQLDKLDGFVRSRQSVRDRLIEGLRPLASALSFQETLPGHEHSAFGFSMVVRREAGFTRTLFQRCLEANGIETRPVVGSNFVRQPVMRHLPYRIAGPLTAADEVHEQGLMIGNHPDVTDGQVAHVLDVITTFVRGNHSAWS